MDNELYQREMNDDSEAREQTDVELESQQVVDDLGLDLESHSALGNCSIQDAIVWCAAHVNDTRIKAKAAPGGPAWVLRQWLRQSPVNESEFWKNLFAKLIPNKPKTLPPWSKPNVRP